MEYTRRSLLAGTAAAGVAGVAGCLGGGNDGGDTNDEADGSGLNLDVDGYSCDLEEPTATDLDYRPTLGDPDADVVVQVFEDFTCGHCATYKLNEFPVIREEYIDTERIRYEHWDFPIPVDETWAVPVASAARGVGAREGDEAFATFASTVYESQGSYDGQAIAEAAEAVDADPCAALADAQFLAYEEASMSDKAEGETMGVPGTPAIFVNGTVVEDGYGANTIAAAIDEAL